MRLAEAFAALTLMCARRSAFGRRAAIACVSGAALAGCATPQLAQDGQLVFQPLVLCRSSYLLPMPMLQSNPYAVKQYV